MSNNSYPRVDPAFASAMAKKIATLTKELGRKPTIFEVSKLMTR